MTLTSELRDILVVLTAAKVGAEVSERLSVPAVVGEIIAGVLIGPSALGLVSSNDVLTLLAQVGVILLLLSVGLEMDLTELAAVGRASLLVATAGVIAPFAMGLGVAGLFGSSTNQAVFIGAALTATSVGITARVFGDLHALASVEARTVLGAAVADDVMGLVILTVVVRVVTVGSLSVATVVGVIAIAVGFLVVSGLVGVRVTPPLFGAISRYSRSSGTVVALALAFTLALAEAADAAKLAPIVGAFMAGVALSRSSTSERIQRELVPVGHLFIPVFFLQIGIDAKLGEFAKPAVLALAGALLVVAVIGKLASVAGLWRSPGDRFLVGVGMVPRGEVGLIFATLGLQQHIFGSRIYAALLLVVLLSTLLPPPVLRWRLLKLRSRPATLEPIEPEPAGGWLVRRESTGGPVVDLAGRPPPGRALPLALDAALACAEARPGERLLEWLGGLPDQPLRWDRDATDGLLRLLRDGGPRSWRFLEVTGMLERALPELVAAISRRRGDASILDPAGALRWETVERLRELQDDPNLAAEWAGLAHPERVWLAAVILDATGDDDTPVRIARRVVLRLDLGAAAEEEVARLVADIGLLPAAAARPGGFTEEPVLQLAAHLGSPELARALYLLTLATRDRDPLERQRLDELHRLVQAVLAHPELTGRDATNLVTQRRTQAARLVDAPAARRRIETAPRHYVLAVKPEVLARAAVLCDPPPRGDDARVLVSPSGEGSAAVEVVAADRVGLLAAEADGFTALGVDVQRAAVAAWPDGCAVGSFETRGPTPAEGQLRDAVRSALSSVHAPAAVSDAELRFDDQASPWHTVMHMTAPDRPGLLHAATAALAFAGVDVHAATIATVDGVARDTFELSDRGNKLNDAAKQRVRRSLEGVPDVERERTVAARLRSVWAKASRQ